MATYEDDEDTKMFGTLQNLVDMLETAPTESADDEDDEQTNEVIGKIMNLVDDMVEKEKRRDNTSSTPLARTPTATMASPRRGTPGSGRSSGRKSRSGRKKRSSPRTELPHYPTPYELWEQSHKETRVETVREKVAKLSKEEKIRLARDVTDRLLRRQREEHYAMMKKQHKKLANELRGLTFVPDLSRTAKMNDKLVQSYEPLYKRYNYVTEVANIKKTKMEQQSRTNELVECSFKPNIRKSMARVSPRKEAEIAESKVEDRCMQYGEEKQMWAEQRREIIKRIETESMTFSPTVSAKSSSIVKVKKMRNEYFPPGSEGRVHGDLERKHRLMKKREEEEKGMFSPAINHRSERKTFSKPVYERLYAMAKKEVDSKRDLQARLFHEKIRNVPEPLGLKHDFKLPAEYENMGLSESEKREIINRMKRLSTSKDIFCPRRYINVVEWNPKYSFIAGQFSE